MPKTWLQMLLQILGELKGKENFKSDLKAQELGCIAAIFCSCYLNMEISRGFAPVQTWKVHSLLDDDQKNGLYGLYLYFSSFGLNLSPKWKSSSNFISNLLEQNLETYRPMPMNMYG